MCVLYAIEAKTEKSNETVRIAVVIDGLRSINGVRCFALREFCWYSTGIFVFKSPTPNSSGA